MSMNTTPADSDKLRSYLCAESALGPHWKPDGTELTFVYNASGSNQVYTVTPGESVVSPRLISSGTERCTDPRFLPDGRIIYTSDVGGNENFQLYLADPQLGPDADGGITRLTSDDGAKYRVVAINENELLFVANDRDKSRFTLYVQSLPLESWAPREVYTPDRGLIELAHRCDTGELLIELHYGNMSHELFLMQTGAGEAAAGVATPPGVAAPPAGLRSLTSTLTGGGEVRWHFIRQLTGDTLLVATDLGSDLFRPVVLSTGGEMRPIEYIEDSIGLEFESAAYLPGSPDTYLEFNEEGYSRLYRMEGDSPETLTPVGLPAEGVVVSGDGRSSRIGLALSPDANRLATAHSGPDNVTNVWVLDIGSGSWQQVTNAGAAGLTAADFTGCSLHRFDSFDNLSVPYFRFLPSSGSQRPSAGWPAVLIIHGGPEAQARPVFHPVIQFLTAGGFAVILPNIRGSAGYGRHYLDLDNREKRLDSIRDIAELARHLSDTDDEIDGGRLAVFGGSYGGFAVLSALTEHPGLWKTGVDIVGISNFVTFLTNTAPWRRKLRESEYGSLDDRALLERISPINKIEEIVVPLLIIQGDNDERVPLSESIQMHDRLVALGRTVELMRFADEGHGVTTLNNRLTAYTRVAEWLNEYL
jgi:pimeloyl-ACP methyl ester carboxylesterase